MMDPPNFNICRNKKKKKKKKKKKVFGTGTGGASTMLDVK